MKSLQLFVSVRVSVLLYSVWVVAVVAGSGDADVGECGVVHTFVKIQPTHLKEPPLSLVFEMLFNYSGYVDRDHIVWY